MTSCSSIPYRLNNGIEIPISLCYSNRASVIRLKADRTGFSLVLPRRAEMDSALKFLRDSSSWIHKIYQKYQALPSPEPVCLPDSFHFQFPERTVPVEYDELEVSRVVVRDENTRIRVRGKISDRNLVFDELRKFLVEYASVPMKRLLLQCCRDVNMDLPRHIRISLQKSRWGSCSARGTLALNGALVFVPERLARYVVMHELCHVGEMNHSQRFWNKLERVYPFSLEARAELNRIAGTAIPAWVFSRS